MREINETKYTRLDIAHVTEKAVKNPQELVRVSEEYYNSQVLSAAVTIQKNMPKYKFILLCGPSASGKTTTAHKLKHRLIDCGVGARVVSMDNFFTGIENYPKLPDGKPDMESIQALDLELLNRCFGQLLHQGESKLPVYDFANQRQILDQHHVVLGENDILIMEGIHALNPEVLSEIPRENIFRMYVSVRTKFINGEEEILIPKDIRLMRRMVRDHKFRGWPPLSTLEQWAHVLEGERVNINPYRDDVDLKMDNTIDYEVCVWHHLLQSLLSDGNREKYEQYPEIQRIFQGLTRFPSVDYRFIPQNSLLREFIGEEL